MQVKDLSALAVCFALTSFSAFADDFTNNPASEPWAERAIASHIDENTIPRNPDKAALQELIDDGARLFSGKFTVKDGEGRPMATQAIVPTKRKREAGVPFMRTHGPDSNACSSCHNDPAAGGAGDFVTNVFVSEGFESADFDSLDPQFSNERGTNHMFGSGLLELLAREMTADLQAGRNEALSHARAEKKAVSVKLNSKGVEFGTITAMADGQVDLSRVEGVDDDLVIRPFSQKGVMTSLRQFTINALNAHFGMEADERFGKRWTGTDDFDEDGVSNELTAGDLSALVAFQAILPSPVIEVPQDKRWVEAAAHGSAVFDTLKCSSCHIRALPLKSATFTDPGPYDAAGTLSTQDVDAPVAYDLSKLDWAKGLERDKDGNIMVPLFGDLKRHVIADQTVAALGNELLAQRFVERNEFMTAELWGVGNTAPYGHRGDMTTLDEVIRAHGGEARASRDAYIAASNEDRSALIAYLKTLVIKP
jgi:hypothetical protein